MERKKRNHKKDRYYVENPGEYIEGNTVRKLEAAVLPERVEPSPEEYDLDQERRNRMRKIQRKREKAKELDLFSVLWLVLAVGITLSVCVKYLSVQSKLTATTEEITTLKNEIIALKEENKAELDDVTSDIDLDYIYKVATKKFGMVHPDKNQVVPYESTKEDSVRQYGDIPNGTSESIISKIFKD